MNKRQHFVAALAALSAGPLARADTVTYAENIRPVFQNICLNCHNPDKHKAGLDLSTYEATMAGSDGGPVVEPGDAGGSLLYRVLTHAEEPFMPAKADPLPDSQLDLIKKWIESGAPESTGGAVAGKGNGTLAPVVVEEKPSGPPAMPHELSLEPVIHARKPGAIAALAASPWAPLVAVAGQKQVLLYNTDTRELAGALPFPEGFPAVLKFSRDGTLLLAGGGVGAKLGRVVVWEVTTGRRVLTVGDEFDTVLAADISADHTLIALGGPGKLVKIFSARDGSLLHKMKKHTDWVTAVCFTPDSKMLITGDRAGGLEVWDTEGREQQSLTAHKAAVTAIACRGDLVATASEDGTAKFWDVREGRQTKSWNAHGGGVTALAIATDGRIVTCGRDRVTRLWDASGNKLREFEPLGDVALQAALAGNNVIAGDWTGALRVWNTDGKRLGALDANPPTLAERVDAVARRISELEPALSNAHEARANAESAASKLSAEVRATGEALRTKEAAVKVGEATFAEAQRAAASAEEIAKKAREEIADLEKKVPLLADNATAATSARDNAQHEQITNGMPKTEGDDDTPKSGASKSNELAQLNDAATKAADAMVQNNAALGSARDRAAQQGALAEKAHGEEMKAQTNLTKLREEFAALNHTLPPKAEQAKLAGEQLAKAHQSENELTTQLTAARSELEKWRLEQRRAESWKVAMQK